VKVDPPFGATVALLGFAFWGAFSGGDSWQMNAHGWFALALGVVLTVALGVGLMALVFFSARRGFDDDHPPDQEP
jgi:hypothetical protein